MEIPTTRPSSAITGGGSEAERRERGGPAAETGSDIHPLIAENGSDPRGEIRERQLVRGRRETVLESYRDGLTSLREESARWGQERAWHAAGAPSYEGNPISGYERLSVERAHTMKDFEKQITELKKENFNLKLRIYFLEEQVQRRCDTSNDELQRMNIELKVEVESLKHDYQEKHNLLVRASKAMESVAGEHELELQRLREEHLKHLQDMEDAQSHKLQLLQSEVQHGKAELDKMCVLLDQERMQRFSTEERLMALNEQYTKSMAILEERDWIIQCLNDTVHSKDALIAQLEKQIASMMPYNASEEKNISNLYLGGDATDSLGPHNPTHSVDGKEDSANQWQEKIKEMDNLINELQQKLEANKAGLAAEEKNSLKRDKAIQGLTMALKKKTKENDKLLSEIDNLNAALSKAREAAQRQSLKENIHPDYKKLIFTLQAEQDVYNRLVKYERESGSLQKELESITMLRKWLEENIQANQELRKIMEAQIMARYTGEDSMSFLLGDQTSYLSICIDHLDQNEYFFAGGPQGTAVSKNNMNEVFNPLREEAGTQTQSDTSVSSERNLKFQQDFKSDLSFSKKSILQAKDYENNAELTISKPNTVSSATQTELSAISDMCLTVSVFKPPKEKEFICTLHDGENHISSQMLPQKTSNNTCEIQEYCRNAKKSRLPVLIKSSLNTKLKSDVALTLAKEDHSCPNKKSHIENGHFCDQPKCVGMKVESLKENKDYIPDQEPTDFVEQAVDNDLQAVHDRFAKECEESERVTPKANEELLKCKDSILYNSSHRESTDQALKQLQAENYQLSKQLEQAKMENQTLKANEDFRDNSRHEKRGSTEQVLQKEMQADNYLLSEQLLDSHNSWDEQRRSTEQDLQKELQAENYRLSEQLKQAYMEIDTLKTNEGLMKYKDALPDSSGTMSIDPEIQVETYRLSEKLQCAQKEIEKLKANEEILRSKASEQDLSNLKNELQAENHQLSEQLKRALIEIETLKASAELMKHKEAVLDLSGSIRERRESTDHKLQAENYCLSEQLILAQMEIEALKASEELLRRKSSECDLNEDEQRKVTEQALQNELQVENNRLSEQLKQAQMEIEILQANEGSIRYKETVPGLSWTINKSTDPELQAKTNCLSEQLQRAQKEIETLKSNEKMLRSKASEQILSNSKDEQRKLTEHASQGELQAENYRLSEQLKQAQMELEALRTSEELLQCKASEHKLPNSGGEWTTPAEQALQKELQAENYRLSEQLKRAQMEMETYKANKELIEHKDIISDRAHTFRDSTDQSLQKELQAEKCRLSQRFTATQMEMEKLQAEQGSSDSDDSLKLHGSDADDDLSEQSFLDKTITNSVNVVQVDVTSDFGDEVCRPHIISHNAVALRCHHDSHCTECANNRGNLPLSTPKSKKTSTRHSSKFTKVSSRRSFEDTTSLSKYDLLVQSQARELSLQRQKIKESHNLSVICSKNFYNLLKAFENLFPASTLDSNITLGFQEQITQTVEWLKELEYKLSDAFYGEEDAYSDHSVDSLLYTPLRLVPGHRMWADKHGCHVLGLVEDYNALRKQILEAKNVLQEMEALIDHGVQTSVLNMTEHFGDIFFEKLSRTKQSLEEAGCLLKLLWRVSLPLQIHSPYSINQEEEVNLEITRLRKRVVEQEKLLSGMAKRVYSENQMKEDIEKLILDQLAMTHDILKRAKGNLEVQVVDKLH
ncbi:CDK5 regulatory subunit-associated protein 2-like [Dendropsophus ebraccatus]|uniref:CDK5 regulatory subunit-associated protein 2-like n=1 Tax=Dendropsophus ebraccatus TaxID=150705 RepID=UPI0038315356